LTRRASGWLSCSHPNPLLAIGHSGHRVTRAGVQEFAVKSVFPCVAGAVALALASLGARAANDNALGEVVITATRTATPVDELAVPVIVITRAEIERSLALDVASLLEGRPGLEIARTGGPGQPAAIFLRGTDSDHTAVLVDGVRINPGTLGGAALQNIQPESIERIEVIKGARSSLYGTDAIGGVINIITRAGAAQGASLYGAAGRYGTQVLAGDAGGQLNGDLAAGGVFVYQRSTGFPPRHDATDPGGYDNRSANAQLRYAAGDALTLHAQAWRADGKSAYSNFGAPADENFLDASYAAGADWHDAAGRSAKLNLSRVTADVRQRQVADFDRTRRDALDAQYSWRAYTNDELTAGAVLANEHAQSLSSFDQPYDVHTHTLLAFAQDQLHRGANELLLAAGYTHHETFGAHTTWNLEYGRVLRAGLRVTLAAGTAFHAPDSTDRYSGFGGNPGLRPEVSRQGQLGLQWQFGSGQQLRFSAFENRIDDLIQYVLLDPVNFTYLAQNVGHARSRGAEAGYSWQHASWRLHADYAVQDPRDLDSGAPLLRRARRNLAIGAQYDAGRAYAGASLQLAGPRADYDDFGNLVTLGGYALLNAGCGWQLAPGWTAQLRLDNALDRRYELVNGYNTPRRSLTLAMRYHMR
jgi:vitamin B12 transporter